MNFNKYDKWLKENKHTIFMSEYNMPFQELLCLNKRVTLSHINQDSKGEKLYINKEIKKRNGFSGVFIK